MSRKSRRRGPIVLSGLPTPKKLRAQNPADALPLDELDAPLPGPILVQLSRLHRSNPSKRGSDSGTA